MTTANVIARGAPMIRAPSFVGLPAYRSTDEVIAEERSSRLRLLTLERESYNITCVYCSILKPECIDRFELLAQQRKEHLIVSFELLEIRQATARAAISKSADCALLGIYSANLPVMLETSHAVLAKEERAARSAIKATMAASLRVSTGVLEMNSGEAAARTVVINFEQHEFSCILTAFSVTSWEASSRVRLVLYALQELSSIRQCALLHRSEIERRGAIVTSEREDFAMIGRMLDAEMKRLGFNYLQSHILREPSLRSEIERCWISEFHRIQFEALTHLHESLTGSLATREEKVRNQICHVFAVIKSESLGRSQLWSFYLSSCVALYVHHSGAVLAALVNSEVNDYHALCVRRLVSVELLQRNKILYEEIQQHELYCTLRTNSAHVIHYTHGCMMQREAIETDEDVFFCALVNQRNFFEFELRSRADLVSEALEVLALCIDTARIARSREQRNIDLRRRLQDAEHYSREEFHELESTQRQQLEGYFRVALVTIAEGNNRSAIVTIEAHEWIELSHMISSDRLQIAALLRQQAAAAARQLEVEQRYGRWVAHMEALIATELSARHSIESAAFKSLSAIDMVVQRENLQYREAFDRSRILREEALIREGVDSAYRTAFASLWLVHILRTDEAKCRVRLQIEQMRSRDHIMAVYRSDLSGVSERILDRHAAETIELQQEERGHRTAIQSEEREERTGLWSALSCLHDIDSIYNSEQLQRNQIAVMEQRISADTLRRVRAAVRFRAAMDGLYWDFRRGKVVIEESASRSRITSLAMRYLTRLNSLFRLIHLELKERASVWAAECVAWSGVIRRIHMRTALAGAVGELSNVETSKRSIILAQESRAGWRLLQRFQVLSFFQDESVARKLLIFDAEIDARKFLRNLYLAGQRAATLRKFATNETRVRLNLQRNAEEEFRCIMSQFSRIQGSCSIVQEEFSSRMHIANLEHAAFESILIDAMYHQETMRRLELTNAAGIHMAFVCDLSTLHQQEIIQRSAIDFEASNSLYVLQVNEWARTQDFLIFFSSWTNSRAELEIEFKIEWSFIVSVESLEYSEILDRAHIVSDENEFHQAFVAHFLSLCRETTTAALIHMLESTEAGARSRVHMEESMARHALNAASACSSCVARESTIRSRTVAAEVVAWRKLVAEASTLSRAADSRARRRIAAAQDASKQIRGSPSPRASAERVALSERPKPDSGNGIRAKKHEGSSRRPNRSAQSDVRHSAYRATFGPRATAAADQFLRIPRTSPQCTDVFPSPKQAVFGTGGPVVSASFFLSSDSESDAGPSPGPAAETTSRGTSPTSTCSPERKTVPLNRPPPSTVIPANGSFMSGIIGKLASGRTSDNVGATRKGIPSSAPAGGSRNAASLPAAVPIVAWDLLQQVDASPSRQLNLRRAASASGKATFTDSSSAVASVLSCNRRAVATGISDPEAAESLFAEAVVLCGLVDATLGAPSYLSSNSDCVKTAHAHDILPIPPAALSVLRNYVANRHVDPSIHPADWDDEDKNLPSLNRVEAVMTTLNNAGVFEKSRGNALAAVPLLEAAVDMEIVSAVRKHHAEDLDVLGASASRRISILPLEVLGELSGESLVNLTAALIAVGATKRAIAYGSCAVKVVHSKESSACGKQAEECQRLLIFAYFNLYMAQRSTGTVSAEETAASFAAAHSLAVSILGPNDSLTLRIMAASDQAPMPHSVTPRSKTARRGGAVRRRGKQSVGR